MIEWENYFIAPKENFVFLLPTTQTILCLGIKLSTMRGMTNVNCKKVFFSMSHPNWTFEEIKTHTLKFSKKKENSSIFFGVHKHFVNKHLTKRRWENYGNQFCIIFISWGAFLGETESLCCDLNLLKWCWCPRFLFCFREDFDGKMLRKVYAFLRLCCCFVVVSVKKLC